jgi:hypothetical protein
MAFVAIPLFTPEGAYMELGRKLIEQVARTPQISERGRSGATARAGRPADNEPRPGGQTLEFDLRKPFDVLVSAANRENGWVNWSGLATLLSAIGQSLEAPLRRLLG